MKIINNKYSAIAGALIVATSTSNAALTSVNVSSLSNTGTAITGAAVLGTAGDQWNVFGSANGSTGTEIASTLTALNDSTGAASGLSMIHSGFYNHTSSTANDVAANANPLQNGWFSRELNGANSVTISGFQLGDIVNLIVYADANDNGANRGNTDITAGGSTLTLNADGNTAGSLVDGTNYVSFIGLTPNGSGEISFNIDEIGGNGNFSDFNGFQVDVTPVPEPSSALLGGLGLLGFLIRRRR